MAKNKAKKVVKGPQLSLLPERTPRIVPAKGSNGVANKLQRVRYVEPPTKSDGKAFYAFRCEKALTKAFHKKYGNARAANAALRKHMSRVTGIAIDNGGNDE
jgi:hypothetical protein